MMTVFLNEKEINIENNVNLFDFLNQKNLLKNYVAVAINRQFVARQHYQTTLLNAGDCIDIVSPMQGG